MNTQPLVSILMTAFNRENFIGEAIESVLSSDFGDFELIIVDDGSRDRSVEIARKYEKHDSRIRVYVNETNLGDYPNRNKAAAYARGKYLKYLDSDDLIYPYGLGAFVEAMEKNPDAALGLCSRQVQEKEPFPIGIPPSQAYRQHFFQHGFLDCGPSGTIVKREVFERFGGFSGKRMVGDFELWLAIAAQHPVLLLSSGLIFWRIHAGQEFAAGMAQGIYMDNLLPLIEKAMAAPNCPLTEDEKNKVTRYYRKIKSRAILKKTIKEKNISKILEMTKGSGLSTVDFINAALFMKKNLNR